MILIPENLESLAEPNTVSKEENKLVDVFGRVLDDSTMMLVKIYPTSGIRADLCIVDKEKGAYFIFSVSPSNNLQQALDIYKTNILPFYVNKISSMVCAHRQLSTDNGNIKTPIITLGFAMYIHSYYRFEAEDDPFVKNFCIFADDLKRFQSRENIFKFFNKTTIPKMPEWNGFTNQEMNAFFYCIAPEYRIPKIQEKVNTHFNDWELDLNQDINIDSSEGRRNFKALALTNEQIELVNSVGLGPQLILSCAGSGKSVILAARAIKTAKAFPDKLVLLTCYNRTLYEYVDFCIDAAGLKSRNLMCKTFHSLCIYLLESNNLFVPPNTDPDKYYDSLCDSVRDALKKGKINQRFFAIFIDEIQDFKQEWYQLCLDLLENRKSYILNICGDKSQDIYRLESTVPWGQGPDCERNRIALRQNYRSTNQINRFIEEYGNQARQMLNKMKIKVYQQPDMFQPGLLSGLEGPLPEVNFVKRLEDETFKVFDIIKKLHNQYSVPYSDIAVLYPYKKSEKFKTYTEYFVSKKLEDESIPHCKMGAERRNFQLSYANRSGVVLSTIYAAKGVDFKAVIICGVRPLIPDIFEPNASENQQKRLYANLNLIYTAAVRAEKHLHWVLSETPTQSIYSKIIHESARAAAKKTTSDIENEADDFSLEEVISKFKDKFDILKRR